MTKSTDKPPETPEQRKQRAEAALARVATIEPKLAAVRGLPFKSKVATAYQSADDFQAFVKRDLATELPASRSREVTAALFHIGLLPKSDDLATSLEAAFTSQAGAYYDPRVDKFFLVMVPEGEAMLDVMSAHELVHGLQDQHFALEKFAGTGIFDGQGLDEDEAIARRFVVEGDATLTMLAYALADATKQTTVDPKMMGIVRNQLETMATLTTADLAKQSKQQAAMFSSMDDDIKRSLDALEALPGAIIEPLLGSYMKGGLMCAVAYERGGWAAVNDLYKNPPQSTEQALHPTTKLYPKREPPIRVTIDATGKALVNDVMGELLWRVYFEKWKPDLAKQAAEGWGGDRFAVFKTPEGLVGWIATAWDTPDDAKQFEDAYVASVSARFPGATGDAANGFARPDGKKIFVLRDGKNVFIADGAVGKMAVNELSRSTTFR